MIEPLLQSEYIFSIFGLKITNTFFTSILVTFTLGVMGLIFYSTRKNQKGVFNNVVRVLIFEILKIIDIVTKNRNLSKKILPLIATFFLFIASANILALLPGFLGSFFLQTKEKPLPLLRSPNSDLTTTLALAVFSVLAIQFFSIRTLGVKKYLARFLNFANPIKFVLGFFETISEGIKILSFSFRLFGNIFAGEVLLLIIAFLVPYIIPVPFMILEVFVGIIQAFIFSMLTLTFIKTSTLTHI